MPEQLLDDRGRPGPDVTHVMLCSKYGCKLGRGGALIVSGVVETDGGRDQLPLKLPGHPLSDGAGVHTTTEKDTQRDFAFEADPDSLVEGLVELLLELVQGPLLWAKFYVPVAPHVRLPSRGYQGMPPGQGRNTLERCQRRRHVSERHVVV